jgi:glutathione S-transferase
MLRLVTIPISHYCEKARWALDRAGLRYREERHVQGIHRLASKHAGGVGTTPVLVTPQGAVCDSADILEWVDQRIEPDRRLLPEDPERRREVLELCARFDAVLGPSGRRLIYVRVFKEPGRMLAFNNCGVPAWEDRALRWGWPLAVRFVSRALAITPGVEEQDERVVWGELDFVAETLADGRPYLCGERFTAADLTFAALSASVLAPPIYGVPLPQPEELPAATAQLITRMREHPAGRFAMGVIAEQRPPPARQLAPIA